MKKKVLYIYRDEPTGIFQLEKFIKLNSKFKNYSIKFVSTEKINYSQYDIKNYYKFTPRNEILKKTIFFKDLNKFETFLRKLKKDDLLFVLGRYRTDNKHNSYDLRLFKKYQVNTIFLSDEPWVKVNFKKSIIVSLIRLLNKLIVEINKFFKKKTSNFLPDYTIGSGIQTKKNYLKNLTAKNYIDLPSYWIDFSKKKNKKNIITYVDESVFYSRDLMLNQDRTRKSSNSNKFLVDLNKFFELVETITNLKVVISCSKKHKNYDDEIFGNRKIFYGKTLELISKSNLVLGHCSEALNQAIYNQVPVVCLRHKTFPLKRNLMIETKSTKFFNKNSIFIEDFIEKQKILDLSIDKKFYKYILYNYFISPNLKFENFTKSFKTEIEKLKNKKKEKTVNYRL